MDRALPGWAIDLIHDGVDRRTLAAGGDRAVWNALVSTAMSALNRGWSDIDWESLVTDPRRKLGQQARLQRGKLRGPARTRKLLTAAWDTAVVEVSKNPVTRTREEAQAEARVLAAQVREFVSDPDVRLPEVDRAVLSYAADAADRYGSTSPALPLRGVAAAVGVSQRQARGALDRLVDAGLLVRTERGRSGQGSRRRAALYRLLRPEARGAYLYLEDRSVLRPAEQVEVAAPAVQPGLAPVTKIRPQTTEPAEPLAPLMLPIAARDMPAVQEALAAAGIELVGEPRVESPGTGSAGEVVPLRRAADRRKQTG